LDLAGYCIDDVCFDGRNSKVLVDSGSNFIMVPSSSFDNIVTSINARKVPGLNYTYQIDCSRRGSLPKIGFLLDGHRFDLSPYDYVRIDEEHRCLVTFMNFPGAEIPPIRYWILGDPFLRAYFSVFDLPERRIGFAKSRPLLE